MEEVSLCRGKHSLTYQARLRHTSREDGQRFSLLCSSVLAHPSTKGLSYPIDLVKTQSETGVLESRDGGSPMFLSLLKGS